MIFNKGNYISTLPCGNQCSQMCYSNVTKKDTEKYIDILLQNGYVKKDFLDINNNLFVTLFNKNKLLNLSYTDYNGVLRILNDPLLETVYKAEEKPYKKTGNTTLAIIPLDYSHREITDGNGMSFVITLEDGRYIIIDGGYGDYIQNDVEKSPRDAEILYEYLKNNNKQKGEKITIAAWIFTHPHADHFGAFTKFTKLYSNSVHIENFIFNNGDPSTYSEEYKPNNFLSKTIFDIAKKHYSDTLFIKPHVGQTLKFCSTEFTVLFTQELCAPDIAPAVNDASMVIKMTSNGKSVLFPADCDKIISDLLVKIYKDFLKSDIMQINHHGYSGVTKELFDCVSPKITIWPTSEAAFKKRVTGKPYEYIGNATEANKYIFDTLGKEGCFVADNTIKTIVF